MRAFKEGREFSGLEDDWKNAALRSNAKRESLAGGRNVLIVPTDPWTLIGAVGDDAMISASVGMVKQSRSDALIYVMTGSDQANQVAERIGLKPLRLWASKHFVNDTRNALIENDIGAVIVLGADVLDGYYGAAIAAKLLISADLAAKLGASVTVLGFSFNAKPIERLKSIFDNLHSNVHLNAREKLSADRFSKFSRHPVNLVADSAFMLEPDHAIDEARHIFGWATAAREKGRLIIGLNAHPMLIKNATPEQIEAIILGVKSVVERVNAKFSKRISWVLIPHDYRDSLGDDRCLLPIYDELKKSSEFDVKYVSGKHRAAVLKAIAGIMDGVVAGRMHLVIASLGMGVPVFALKYQDKFEGLLGLFGIDQSMSVTSDEILFSLDEFERKLNKFIDEISDLKVQVFNALPRVKAASKLNFEPIVKND